MQKYTKLYRCPDNTENLQIRVRLKEIKREDDDNEDEREEVRVFSWQEKVYGIFERDFYKDEKNCITDLDKKYHNDVVDMIHSDDKMFSYVDEDSYSVSDEIFTSSTNVSKLCYLVNNLSINEDENKKEYDFETYLNNSITDPFLQHFNESMHIMADFGEYFENTWLKAEQILVTLKYNNKDKVLSICPDFSRTKPYELQISGDMDKTYHYYIENVSVTMSTEALIKESQILSKVAAYKQKFQVQNYFTTFDLPQKNILQVHLFVEILCAKNFEYDNIYVQYFIDLPNPWKCKTPQNLKGYTHASVTKGTESLAHFGFPFDICLEYNLQNLREKAIPRPPYIYFEVISKDTWNRFRTEGLTYKSLPISQPGIYEYDLPCFRICPKNPLLKMKRFFIGDYASYNDLSWVGLPKDYEGSVINKCGVDTVGTGEIRIKVNVLHHCQAFIAENQSLTNLSREKFLLEKLKSSHLIKSVEQVLETFKRARKNMLEARRNV